MESGSLFILCIPQSMDLCELVVADKRLSPDTPTGEGSADLPSKSPFNIPLKFPLKLPFKITVKVPFTITFKHDLNSL